jgi:aryl-alcohol dehydrogenase-like predicted oxidoreductase
MVQSKLILGTVQFGLDYGINNADGKPTEDAVNSILDTAFNHGIKILDTAEAYGNAIELIKNYHERSLNRFDIISKFKYAPGVDIESSVTKTITDLGIDSLFGYMFHSYDDVNLYPQLVEKVVKMQTGGFIKNVGVSVYTNQQFEAMINRPEFNLIQLPYNLLDNSLQRGGLIAKAKQAGKIIHVRSVFLQGLFFKDLATIDAANLLAPLKPSLKTIQALAESKQVSLTALALNYALQNPGIDGVLFGVDTPEQLKQNLLAAETAVAKEVFTEIDKLEVTDINLLSPVNWK